MADRDTTILLVVLGLNLVFVSALLVTRLRASGQGALAPRLVAETWLTFALAFLLFRSMQRMLGGAASGQYGAFTGLTHTVRQFGALGAASKAWFIGGGALAVGLLIHLIVAISRACSAPLKSDSDK
jgi:hypothetical protein